MIVNVEIFFNFEKEWCTFHKEKKRLKEKTIVLVVFFHAKGLLKHQQFASSFE